MPDTPVAHTEDLANAEYDAGHRARVAGNPGVVERDGRVLYEIETAK